VFGWPAMSELAIMRVEWRKRLGVEPSPPAQRGKQPILKTGRATGPRSLPENTTAYAVIIIRMRDGTGAGVHGVRE
jgi:hypothetical protein